MTKGPGQKHYQREDQEHAAHQNEAAGQNQGVGKKAEPSGRNHAQHGGHPVEEHPKSPQKGQ